MHTEYGDGKIYYPATNVVSPLFEKKNSGSTCVHEL